MTQGVSMEEFGPIAADYYNGRVVESVEQTGDGWVIKMEGGAEIHNFSPLIEAPKAITGAALTMVVLGGHDPDTGVAQTELRFGLEAVKLDPIQYAMSDPAYTKGQLVFPQRSTANMTSQMMEQPTAPEQRLPAEPVPTPGAPPQPVPAEEPHGTPAEEQKPQPEPTPQEAPQEPETPKEGE